MVESSSTFDSEESGIQHRSRAALVYSGEKYFSSVKGSLVRVLPDTLKSSCVQQAEFNANIQLVIFLPKFSLCGIGAW